MYPIDTVPPEDGLHVLHDVNQPGLERNTKEKRSFPTINEHADDTSSNIHHPRSTDKSKNPFGLSPLVFGILIALITTVVVGGAVGGSLGSKLKSSGSDSSASVTTTSGCASQATSPTASPTIYTNYAPALPSQVVSLVYDCPNLSGTVPRTAQGDLYTLRCYVDYWGNDIAAVIAYRVEDCCTACSAYNYQQSSSNLTSKCMGFTFNANMTNAILKGSPAGGVNCYLKDVTGSPWADPSPERLLIGGILVAV